MQLSPLPENTFSEKKKIKIKEKDSKVFPSKNWNVLEVLLGIFTEWVYTANKNFLLTVVTNIPTMRDDLHQVWKYLHLIFAYWLIF